MGEAEVQLRVDILFSVVSVRAKMAFKSYFIIIFLCRKLNNKEASKTYVQYACLFKDLLFFYSFWQLHIYLPIQYQHGQGGLLGKNWTVEDMGMTVGGGYKLAKVCGHPLFMTSHD